MPLPKFNLRDVFSHEVLVVPRRSVRTFNNMLLTLLEIVVPAFLASVSDDDDEEFLSCVVTEFAEEICLNPTAIMAAAKTIVSITTSDDKSVDDDHIDPGRSGEAGMPWLS